MAICEKCGKEHEEHDLFTVDGEKLCRDCLEEMDYVQCQDCGEWFPSDEGYEYDGEPLCETCYENNYFTCDDCGEVVHDYDAISIHNSRGDVVSYVCDDCADRNYYRCIDCGDWFVYNDEGVVDDNGDFVCEHCYEWNDWVVCSDCGCLTRDYEEGDDGEWYCSDCIGDHEDNDDGETFGHLACQDCSRDNGETIHTYGFKPRPEIKARHNEPENADTFGVELEIDGGNYSDRNDCAEAVKEAAQGRAYLKSDGSLNSGFEIVTHPGTLAHHMYEMPWKGIAAKAKKYGFKSHDAMTCGLHIHVGRASMGSNDEERIDTARKIKVLVVRYWDELVQYSRRTGSQLRWCEKPHLPYGYRLDADLDEDYIRQISYANDHNNRYYAINCENEATVEFRIFRGTLKRDTIIASLQLCWNIVNYAKSHTWSEIQHSCWIDVAQYKRWNENDAYLAFRGLAPAPDSRAQNTDRSPDFGGYDGLNG